jgi:hypothetical protein
MEGMKKRKNLERDVARISVCIYVHNLFTDDVPTAM